MLLSTLIDAYRAVPVLSGALSSIYLELLLCGLIEILQDLLIRRLRKGQLLRGSHLIERVV